MLVNKEQMSTVVTSPINSSKLHQLWKVIDETQTNILLGFSDTELIQQLLRQLEIKGLISYEEVSVVSSYLGSRVPLIRDLARSRMAV